MDNSTSTTLESTDFRIAIPKIMDKLTPEEAITLGRFYKICTGVVTSDKFSGENPKYTTLNRTQRIMLALSDVNNVCDASEEWSREQAVGKIARMTARQLAKLAKAGSVIDPNAYGPEVAKLYAEEMAK